MRGWLWRRVRRQLDQDVPSHRSASVIGDLQEDYVRRRASIGPIRARLWLWREARSLTRAYRGASGARAGPARLGAGLLSDTRFAVRRLRAAPGFTVFAVLTLALGIGSTTAIYSVIRSVLGPPPGVRTLDRLVTITHSAGGSVPMIALSYGDFLDLQTRHTVFQDVAGWSFRRFSLAAGGETATGWGELVTSEYFRVLGVQFALGRGLQAADNEPGAPPVAVISHSLWRRMFGGTGDAIGRLIKVNGVNCEIAGVASPEFAGLFNSGRVPSAIWLPLATVRLMSNVGYGDAFNLSDRSNRWIQVRARLKPDVTLDTARADVTRIAQQLDAAVPLKDETPARSRYRESRGWMVRRTADTSLNEGADRIVGQMAAVVMAIVGVVLLVACTNLANLMLARGSGRRHEIAVRLALGTSRGRLIRAELAESIVLSAAGGLVGLGVARVVITLLGNDVAVGNSTFVRFTPVLDVGVLAMSGTAAALSILVAGLLPALQSTRADLRSALAAGGSSAALPRWRGRRMLIAAQVMVSIVLVAIAALCIRQVREQSRVDVGVDLEHLALAEIDFSTQQYPEGRVQEIVAASLAAMARRPDVAAVSASSGLPIGIGSPGAYAGDSTRLTHRAELLASTSGIFETLGVRLLTGRALSDQDVAGSAPVAVVAEFTAKALFGTSDVVGRPIYIRRTQWAGEPERPTISRLIVGVVTDVRSDREFQGAGGVVYVPLAQQREGRLVIAARTLGDPVPLVGAIRQSLAAADRDLALTQAGTGLALAGPDTLFLQITAGLTGILGSFALVLALVGLYGALSHVVLRRRREIGLRMALGATRGDVLRMILRDGLRPVTTGIVLGLVVGGIARLFLSTLFYRLLPPLDPFVLTVVPVLLLAIGAAACLIPARRASRVEPNLALRDL